MRSTPSTEVIGGLQTSTTGPIDSWPGERMHIVIDDVIYFDAQVGIQAP